MKALVYTGPHTVEMQNVDDAKPLSNDDVVVAVAACGICGSDMHAYHGVDARRPPPLILGHEAAGTIIAGDGIGKRVAVNPLVTCGTCTNCLSGRPNICPDRKIVSMAPRPGAFAEQVAVPAANAVEIPDGMSMELAAMTEPFAVSYHAINLGENALNGPLAAANVAVIGGGAIGLAAAQIARSRGARQIAVSEPSETRRGVIDGLGELRAYDPRGGAKPADNSMDLVVDAYGGAASRAEASRLVRPGGVIIHIGLESGEGGLDIRKATLQEVTFIGTYTYTMLEFRETLAALATGQFGEIPWTETRPLFEGAEAFRALDEGGLANAKIILTP